MVEVSGCPSPQVTEEAKDTVPRQKEEAVCEVRILVDLCVSNGLYLRQGNLSYVGLKCLEDAEVSRKKEREDSAEKIAALESTVRQPGEEIRRWKAQLGTNKVKEKLHRDDGDYYRNEKPAESDEIRKLTEARKPDGESGQLP